MELINEINTIKNLMNLEVLNEAGAGSWLDDVWMVTKDILKTFFNKSSLESFIKNGFGAQEFKSLKKAILDSPKRQLGVELKNSLTTAMNNLPQTATAQRLLINTRIKQIDDLITSNPLVTKKLIKNTMVDLEKSYPTLFQKKWYGSYVNQGKISSVEKQLIREFKGKSAKDIELSIESTLSKAESTLSKIKMPQKRKSAYQKIIKNYGEYIKKNPIKGPLVTLGAPPVIGIVVYLLYGFFENWYDTGSPISAVMSSGTDIWGDIKKGWYSAKPYPAGAMGLLSYLNEKYGNKNWKNEFRLDINGNSYIITHLSSGESKSFEHNGKTFIEL